MIYTIEHLLFEGSQNIERGKYSELVEKNGGELNANTSQDRTYYYEIFPSNKIELGLWLESERMLHPVINQDGVDTQNEVVKEEKRLRVDNQPYGRFLEYVKHVLLLAIPKPGFSGQKFDMEILPWIDELNQHANRQNFEICLDGGVNKTTVKYLNVESVVSGSFILSAPNPIKNIMLLQTSGEYEKY